MRKKKYNVLWIMSDSMRAESLSCYGHPTAKTPNFDKLAEEGTLFENCYTPYPICGPARCCMMTGWYPRNSGFRKNNYVLENRHPNLFKNMRQNDYYVAWYGKNDLFSPEIISKSVDECSPPKRYFPFGERIYSEVDERGYYSFLRKPPKGDKKCNEDYTTYEMADEFFSNYEQDKPFMLFLALSHPHVPFSVPEPYHNMYRTSDVEELRPSGLKDEPAARKIMKDLSRMEDFSDEELRRCAAVYMGMVSYSDYVLGEVVESLKRNGLYENTIIMAFSDHGEYAGDYGLVGKICSGQEDVLLRVPLIIRLPEALKGVRVPGPVSLLDVAYTTAQLTDTPLDEPHFGFSLVDSLYGKSDQEDRIVFSEGGFHFNQPYTFDHRSGGDYHEKHPEDDYTAMANTGKVDINSNLTAVTLRTNTHKLVYRPRGVCELYDMEKDSKELDNLYYGNTHIEIRDQLKAKLMDWCVECCDIVPYGVDHSRKTPLYKSREK